MLKKLFAKKPIGSVVTLKIDGMHCVSCGMNIDGVLEEIEGVYSAKTHYAKAQTVVEYDPQRVDVEKIRDTVINQGYKIVLD